MVKSYCFGLIETSDPEDYWSNNHPLLVFCFTKEGRYSHHWWKVPGRSIVSGTFKGAVLETLWCYGVLKIFPYARMMDEEERARFDEIMEFSK